MSNRTTNNYPGQNNWHSDRGNMRMTPQLNNFQNNPAIHNFTNPSTHVPQRNYPISNVRPNSQMSPPFNATRHSSSFEMRHSIEPISERNPYSQAPNMNHSFNPQGLNNFAPESTFERGFSNQAPPNYPTPKQNPRFDSGPPPRMQFPGQKNNFNPSNCTPNNTQLNLPPLNFQNNPKVENCTFEHAPPFHNNFQECHPTQGPSHQQRKTPFNQNCGPTFNLPPPNQRPIHATNSSNFSGNSEHPHQSGQFGFGPPCRQLLTNEKPFQNNSQCFSNLNVMLPPPPLSNPLPPPFLTPPPFGPPTTQENNNAGCVTATASKVVSEEENRLDSYLQRFQIEKKGKPKNGMTVRISNNFFVYIY